MKKIQKEVVTKRYEDVFIANDGTEFSIKEECEKYENSAKCVLLTRFQPMVIKNSDEWSLFGFGSEDHEIDVVRINSQADFDLLLQLIILENSYCYEERSNDTEEEIKEKESRKAKLIARLQRAFDEKDLVFISRGYEHDGFYFEGTRNEHISVLMNIDKPKEEKAGE